MLSVLQLMQYMQCEAQQLAAAESAEQHKADLQRLHDSLHDRLHENAILAERHRTEAPLRLRGI